MQTNLSAPAAPLPEFLPTAAAAVLLGLPEATLRFWRYQGTGPKSFKLGPRRVVYRREHLLTWIADQEQATTVGGGI